MVEKRNQENKTRLALECAYVLYPPPLGIRENNIYVA